MSGVELFAVLTIGILVLILFWTWIIPKIIRRNNTIREYGSWITWLLGDHKGDTDDTDDGGDGD
jgi:hypothetical protein